MISSVILYKNEKESLGRCLKSLAWCDDIVIVQDAHGNHSDLASPRPEVHVVLRTLNGDFSAQRTFGMEHAKYDWILFVDADEELSPDLATLLSTFSPDNDGAGYTIPRVDVFWGRQISHGEVHEAAHRGLLRLIHKHRGRWEGTVHERFVPTAHVRSIEKPLLHYPHQSIASFLEHINTYSSLRAKEIMKRPVWSLFGELVLFPPLKFLYTYGIKLGFLDGPAGFVYSFMMSFHSFLVRAKAITKTYDI